MKSYLDVLILSKTKIYFLKLSNNLLQTLWKFDFKRKYWWWVSKVNYEGIFPQQLSTTHKNDSAIKIKIEKTIYLLHTKQ